MTTEIKIKYYRYSFFKIIAFWGILIFLANLFFSCGISNKETIEDKNPNGKNDSWGYVGPGGGGAMFYPTISPYDSDFVFVSCDMTGSFVTYDGGESWRMFNLCSPDPLDPNTVYANSIALFKSSDKGYTWSVVYPSSYEITGLVSKGDHAQEIIVTKDSTDRKVLAFTIDPENSKKLYAAISIDKSIAFYISDDGGQHWDKETELEKGIRNIYIVPSSPKENRTIYITGKNIITSRKNGIWKINKGPEGVINITSYSGGFSKEQNKFIIYAISGKGYFNPKDEISGIFYTNDGGKTWILSLKDELKKNGNIPSSNFQSGWLNERFGPTWGENPFSIGVSPTNPDIVYATDFGRTIKTTNGGISWEQIYTNYKKDAGWMSRGLEVTTAYGVIFDPFDSNHIFLLNTDTGLMESKDGGESWSSGTKENGIPRNWRNNTYWLAFDPEVKGKMWAVMSGSHDLPRPKMWEKHGISKFKGGILMSDNGGESWKQLSKKIGEAAFTHILIDPESDKGERTLYACAFGKGVYKSVDGGKTWQQKNDGLKSKEPFAWRIERRKQDGVLFLIQSHRSDDGSINNEGDGAIYRSDDDAESWTAIKLPEGSNAPTSLAIDPHNPNHFLLSAWERSTNGKYTADIGGGIFISKEL